MTWVAFVRCLLHREARWADRPTQSARPKGRLVRDAGKVTDVHPGEKTGSVDLPGKSGTLAQIRRELEVEQSSAMFRYRVRELVEGE